MIRIQEHILKKFELNVDLSPTDQPQTIRNFVLEKINNQIRNELEKIMDECCPTDQLIQLDTLKVDVGDVKLEDLTEVVIKALKSTILTQVEAAQRSSQHSLINRQGSKVEMQLDSSLNQKFADKTNLLESNFDSDKSGNSAIKSTFARKIDGAVDFLISGCLEWWNPLKSQKEIENVLFELINDTSKSSHQIALRNLAELFKVTVKARERFIFSLSPALIESIYFEIQQKSVDRGNILQQNHEILQLLNWFNLKITNSDVLLKLIYLVRFNHLAKKTTKTQLKTATIVKEICQLKQISTAHFPTDQKSKQLFTAQVLILMEWEKNSGKSIKIPTQITSPALIKKHKEWQQLIKIIPISEIKQIFNLFSINVLGLKLEEAIEAISAHKSVENLAIEDEEKALKQLQIEKSHKLKAKKKRPTETEDVAPNLHKEAAYFNFAGIVILWPLFLPLFEDRGLLDGKNFKDEEAQFKALQFLNYLANGDEEVDEVDRPLHKVLCGIPRNQTVLFTSELSEADKTELNILLEHMIKHWSALKNTSINGLRQGFIQRNGQLVETEEHWLLKVEQRSIDLLLDKIPWGFRMINLPWMNKIMQVEW